MKVLKEPKSIVALFVFFVSFIVYTMTVAPTTSFWDCGEFIACSYILGIPHPPGSPLFILVGRIFSILPIGEDIGFRVNMMSPILSAFSAMFTFLIIVRLLEVWQGKADSFEKKLIQYSSGVIGALAFAWSDSQWFNSVEAEVYAASLFFTAIVVWLVLKWMDDADAPRGDRWLLLIAYLVGLALGVHLLNLLALPMVFMIIYFRREQLSLNSAVKWAAIAAGSFVVIYPGVVKYIPKTIELYSFFPVLLLPVILAFLTVLAVQKKKHNYSLMLMSLMLVLVGYSTYNMIYIRSSLNPAIDENAPDTPEKFVSYLNREQYGDWSIMDRASSLQRSPNAHLYTKNIQNPEPEAVRDFFWNYQIKKMFVRYFGWQYIGKGDTKGPDGLIAEIISVRGLWGIPFLLGFLGLMHHFWNDWRRALSIFVLFIMTGIAIVIYLNQPDPQPRERDYAYTGAFFAYALWIGIGVSFLLEYISDALRDNDKLKRPAQLALVALLLIAVPINMLAFNYREHSRDGNYVAHDYSLNILESCEPDAILFTNGDNDTFPLWYLQNVEGIRRDVRVVNLSLLNTPWYIKQLRDQEPRVPIRLKDRQVDALQPMYWPDERELEISVPPQVREQWIEKLRQLDPAYKPDSSMGLRFVLGPTIQGQGIRVQDIMIMHILEANQFKKPVYFAVTVSPDNKIGLDKYLRMDGLVFRVLPVKTNGLNIDPDLLYKNLTEKYTYRNLNNPDVYYNDNIIALLGNYRSAFLKLTQHYLSKNEKDKALAVLDAMEQAMPEEVVPPAYPDMSILIGQMYRQAGRPEELKKRIDKLLRGTDFTPAQKSQFVPYYAQELRDMAAAESLASEILQKDPSQYQAYAYLVEILRRQGDYDKSLEMVESWLALDPENPMAKNTQKQLQTLTGSKKDSAGAGEEK